MLFHSMRRVLIALTLLLSCLPCACRKPSFEPAVLSETRELDAEVLQLIEQKVAAVRAAPGDARAHADLGLVYEANGLWDASEQSFGHALAIEPSNSIWLYHRALALREGGQSAAALAALRSAAEQRPKDAAVQQRLGQWLLDGGDADGAHAAFSKALECRPDQPEFLTGLAGVEIARGRWSEAFALAKRALKGNPGYAPGHFVAGQALQGLGRSEEAKPQLAAGLNAKVNWCQDELSRDFDSYQLTTNALATGAASANVQGNYARAVELYEKLAQRKPEDADMQNNLGANLIELGRLDRAAEVLGKALALAPQSFAVHLNLSELYLRQKLLPEARDAAQKAVDRGGTVGRTHYQLAKVFAAQNDQDGRYRELKAAAALDARDTRLLFDLGDTCWRLGRLEEARAFARKGLELEPNSLAGRLMQGVFAQQASDFDEARAALAVRERLAPQDQKTVALREQLQKSGH